jgi:hypothetical protein
MALRNPKVAKRERLAGPHVALIDYNYRTRAGNAPPAARKVSYTAHFYERIDEIIYRLMLRALPTTRRSIPERRFDHAPPSGAH